MHEINFKDTRLLNYIKKLNSAFLYGAFHTRRITIKIISYFLVKMLVFSRRSLR